MKPPIVLNESSKPELSGDVMFFSSVEEAAAYIEPIDVENGEYYAFDSSGLKLDLETDGDQVLIHAAEALPTHQQTLQELLCDFYKRTGDYGTWCETATLGELIEHGAQARKKL